MKRTFANKFVELLPLLVRDKLALYLARSLPPINKAKMIQKYFFVQAAKFHPDIQCFVGSYREYKRSQKIIHEEILEWIGTFEEGDIFYDVGANIGMFSLFVAKHWQGGVKVFAFEPSSPTYATLIRNVVLNQFQDIITCFEVALGSKTAIGTFNYSDLDAGSALHALNSLLDNKRESFTPVFRQPILSYSLDDLVEKFGIPMPNHVKIDVDGTEPDVISGFEKILASGAVKTVLIEMLDLVENDERTLGIKQKFASFGFEQKKMIVHNKKPGFPRTSDYLFVQKEYK